MFTQLAVHSAKSTYYDTGKRPVMGDTA